MSRTLFLLFLLYAVRGYTQTPVSGDVSGVWMAANSPYFINGSVTVPAGQTLTIEPGVEILSPGNGRIYVNGALIARGTTMDSIRFLCPDSIAWAGSVIFGASSSGSILQYVRLDRWGNTAYAGDIGAIQLLTGSVNITRSLVSNSEASGIMADQDISPAITDNAFTGGTYAINARPGSLSNVTRNTNANIHLINANISGTAVMPQPGPGSLYVLDEGFTIVAGGTLTIQPGTRLQSASAQGGINVYGSLIANGTATDSIFFSTPDSLTYGGTIIVNPGAVNVQFQYIHIDHWGNVSFAGDIGALRLLTSPVSITHSVVSNSAGTGIMANENISPVISGNVFYGCTYAISAQPGSLSAVTANRTATIHLINANISDSAVLPLPGPGSFYLLDQGFTILQGASLTLQPGLLIQSTSTADHINVYGSLIASGTATDSIRFVTSDSTAYGGTSYGGSIVFNSGGGSSILQYASFNRWGNTSYAGDIGTIWLMNAQVNISACSFSDPQGTAIMLNSAISPVVTGNRFTNCPFAIQAQPGSLTYVTANSNANIGLINSNVSDSAVLPLPGPGSYYFLNQGFTILQGASLTLLPGLLIQSTSAADQIDVYGSLIARGTAMDSIRFTTTDSAAYGGTVIFHASGDSSFLQYASFNRWGNTSYAGDLGAIWLLEPAASIANCSFSNAQGTGIVAGNDPSPSINACLFSHCPRAIIALPGGLSRVLDNSNANIYIANDNVTDTAVMPSPGPGSYYVLAGGFTINQHASLTIGPGTEIRSGSGADNISV